MNRRELFGLLFGGLVAWQLPQLSRIPIPTYAPIDLGRWTLHITDASTFTFGFSGFAPIEPPEGRTYCLPEDLGQAVQQILPRLLVERMAQP